MNNAAVEGYRLTFARVVVGIDNRIRPEAEETLVAGLADIERAVPRFERNDIAFLVEAYRITRKRCRRLEV